jgi:hypothetical protein
VSDSKKNFVAQEFKPSQPVAEPKKVEPVKIKEKEPHEKYFEEREKNAIVDLLTSQACNNIFIGNYNPVLSRGSTFSYYIYKMIKATNIFIDLDSIYDDEYIIKNYREVPLSRTSLSPLETQN